MLRGCLGAKEIDDDIPEARVNGPEIGTPLLASHRTWSAVGFNLILVMSRNGVGPKCGFQINILAHFEAPLCV